MLLSAARDENGLWLLEGYATLKALESGFEISTHTSWAELERKPNFKSEGKRNGAYADKAAPPTPDMVGSCWTRK